MAGAALPRRPRCSSQRRFALRTGSSGFLQKIERSSDALLSVIHILFGVIQPKQLTVSTLTPDDTVPNK